MFLVFIILFMVFIGFILILSGIIYQDVKDISSLKGEVKIVYEQNNNIITGFTWLDFQLQLPLKNTNIKIIPEEELARYNTYFNQNNLSYILGNGSLLVIFTDDFMNELYNEPVSIDFLQQEFILEKIKFFDVMENDNPLPVFFNKELSQLEKELLFAYLSSSTGIEIKEENELKALLLSVVLSHYTYDKKQLFLQYKKDNILVYPKSVTSRVVKSLPIQYFI